MAIEDDLPIRGNSDRVEASWFNTIRQVLVDYGIGVHEALMNNPHNVTKTQVGLGNVTNVDAVPRANHTGTQLAATISDFAAAVGALTGLTSFKTTSDLTSADSVTFTNLSELQFPVVAGKNYEMRMILLYQSTVAASGISLNFNTIDTAVVNMGAESRTQINADGVNAAYTGSHSALNDLIDTTTVAVINTNYVASTVGILKCTTSGIISPQFRRDSGAGTITVYAASVLNLREIG